MGRPLHQLHRPVPEDKAFRVTEMQAAIGSQPLMTANEGRDSYLGLGPVDGGDRLMAPTTMVPVGEAQEQATRLPSRRTMRTRNQSEKT